MDVASSNQGSRSVATTVDHPRLTKTDSASTRKFLREYDQFAHEVTERAQQLVGDHMVSTELAKPVQLKFCVNSEWVESVIDLWFITDVGSYAALHDETLRSYLESKASASKGVITIDSLDKLVETSLRIDMTDKDARSRIESLLAIRPDLLRNRLESDLELSHHELRKDFKGFMAHAIKLSEAFQLVDNGPATKSSKTRKKRQNDNDDKDGKDESENRKRGRTEKVVPMHEKKGLLQRLADEKAATGPARSIRAPTATDIKQEDKSVGRVTTLHAKDSSSFDVTFTDGDESHIAKGHADDGADESIVSSRIAEHAVLNGIGKMKKISPVTLQVALKDGIDAEKFTFSRTWTAPRTILKLEAGPPALLSVEYLVSDADLAAEDLLLGLPVLRHLGVDTKTLLEERRDLLDGSDCSTIPTSGTTGKGGRISRLIIARLNRISDNHYRYDNDWYGDVSETEKVIGKKSNELHVTRETAIDYYEVREEEDPFPDASNLDPPDYNCKGTGSSKGRCLPVPRRVEENTERSGYL